MAHTPGPFIAWDDGRTIGIETEHGPIAVAEIVDHGGMADETRLLADQLLFTASADMLAALKDAQRMIGAYVLLLERGRNETDASHARYVERQIAEIVAKAEGAA